MTHPGWLSAHRQRSDNFGFLPIPAATADIRPNQSCITGANKQNKNPNTKISLCSFRANMSSVAPGASGGRNFTPPSLPHLPPLASSSLKPPLKGNIVFCLTVHACVIHRCREGDLHSGQPRSGLRHGPLREEDGLSQRREGEGWHD